MGLLICLDVGFGDASIIQTDKATFLIDCHSISDYQSYLPKEKNIRAIFITHQHNDHYSGLNYLQDNGYSIDYLIYSPYDRRRGDNSVTIEEWNEFNSLKDSFISKGTKPYAVYRQDNFDKPWWDTGTGVKFWIVGPDASVANTETREIHDASLVIEADIGERVCLFAGDASDINLEYVANKTKNYCDDILHASHHGSLNGAHLEFVKKSNAKYTLISTKAGVHDNVPHPTALKRYKDYTEHDVRRTDIDHTWSWEF